VVGVLAIAARDWRKIADKFRSCEAVTAAKADACADVLADVAFDLGLRAEFDAAVRGEVGRG
jgi:hypothetical protein